MKNVTIINKKNWRDWIETLRQEVKNKTMGDASGLDRVFGNKWIDQLKIDAGQFQAFVVCWEWISTNNGPYLHFYVLNAHNCDLISTLAKENEASVRRIANIREQLNNALSWCDKPLLIQ